MTAGSMWQTTNAETEEHVLRWLSAELPIQCWNRKQYYW